MPGWQQQQQQRSLEQHADTDTFSKQAARPPNIRERTSHENIRKQQQQQQL
jgi:hypothetical protein